MAINIGRPSQHNIPAAELDNLGMSDDRESSRRWLVDIKVNLQPYKTYMVSSPLSRSGLQAMNVYVYGF